jgi:hypothetical protein
VEAPEPRRLDLREFDVSDVIDVEQATAMDESHNLIMTGIMAGQFLKSILKYGERASLNEVHARQYNPAFQKRPPLAKFSPSQLRPNIPLSCPAGLSFYLQTNRIDPGVIDTKQVKIGRWAERS